MKSIMQKSRICSVLFLMLFFSLFKSPVYGQDKTEEFVFLHTHADTCFLMLVRICEADGTPYGEITKRETCQLCGAELHHYRFQTKCSCGAFFDHTGFACMNSPYGSNVGDCTNYEVVEGTMHEHAEKVQVCPLQEGETVAKVSVYRDMTGMTKESVTLQLVMEKGSGSAYFQESNTSELTVSQNGTVEFTIVYDEGLISQSCNRTINVNNIDRIAPEVSLQISPDNWTEGNCTVSIQASDIADGINAVSGVAESGYSFDGGKTWTTNSSMEFEDTIQGEIQVKDNAGNITGKTFYAEKKEPPTETTKEPPKQEEIPTERAEQPSEKNELPSEESEMPDEQIKMPEEQSGNENDAEEVSPKRIREAKTLEEQNTVSNPQEGEATADALEALAPKREDTVSDATFTEEMKGRESGNNNFTFASMYKRIVRWMKKPVVAVSFGAASISGGVLILAGYYFLIGMGTIACIDGSGSEKFLAKIAVRRKRGRWNIVIGEELAEKCRTRNLVLYVPSWFAKLFAYQTISIDMPNGIQEFYVEKRLSFLLLE